VLTAGIAGVAAGAMAMAAGEYVSVSAQVDVEHADLEHEARQHAADPDGELVELADIYERRGLPRPLAAEVARTLHSTDPVAAHARDELGQTPHNRARPVQAALASAGSFLVGGVVPFLGIFGQGAGWKILLIFAVTVVGLVAAGILASRIAGGSLLRPTVRVVGWGGAAMLVTAAVGQLVHLAGI
jgi:VIT1/CCC1 family predicted Fe2+/Mn2+ transporter